MDQTFLDQIANDLDLDSEAVEEGAKKAQMSELEQIRRNNVLRCRRHREKKKREEEQTVLENMQLKRERVELKTRISDLQFEVQALRGQAVIDLSKENELLRMEIKRHKKYIERVVEVTQNTPLDVEDIETLRLMKSGIESGAGQVCGLAYSSIHSDAWLEGVLKATKRQDQHFLREMRVLYQYLPLGSSKKEATRLNFRIDFEPIPIPYKTAAKNFWDVFSNVDLMTSSLPPHHSRQHITFQEIYPKTKLQEDEEMYSVSLQNVIDGKKKEAVFVLATKELNMYDSAFAGGSLELEDRFREENVKIVVFSSLNGMNSQRRSKDPDVERIGTLSTEGLLFRDQPDGNSAVSMLCSLELSSGFADLILQGHDFITDDGAINLGFIRCLKAQFAVILSLHKAGKKKE